MSDEPILGQPATTQVATQQRETPSDAWGQPISPERQAELQEYLDRWEAKTDHNGRRGSVDEVKLTGADVFWLADQSKPGMFGVLENLHLETLYVNPPR
jgi:hypothetical protein